MNDRRPEMSLSGVSSSGLGGDPLLIACGIVVVVVAGACARGCMHIFRGYNQAKTDDDDDDDEIGDDLVEGAGKDAP